ncbi:MlaA family lipoprotein [Microbulbifer hainanensis]|uniref:MlaA family lipoprotein n=1 Tax=Microbulbifer hainanensis TaxID=2735675 RepID=UPI001D02B783|nr:VacJ family lipoprotein [Microbulbifer hainanensis]
MLGRTVYSPWLLAVTLAFAPSLSLAAEDPFAETTQDVSAPQMPDTGTAASKNTEGATGDQDATDSGTAGADASGDGDPFGDGAAGSDSSGLEDEYGFDPADEFASDEEPAERDPWEGFNRAVFRFNDTADRWVLKPVATTYRQVTPVFMQLGITNFFGNLLEVANTFNSVLQWKWGQAGNDAGRFLVNSTVGVAGLFDVAQHMGLEASDGEDFGQTLAVWGVPEGPYLVLPFVGPSTVRDAPGVVVDWYTNPLTYIEHEPTYWAFRVTDLVQTRAGLLKAETLLKGDRYVLLRDAYLQRREYLIKDGELEDDFGTEVDENDF